MKDTKQNILSASRELFNELGYSQVTIRMIALKLNMSPGNLNYHFKKREEILEALYFEMVDVFDKRVKGLKNESITFKKIKSDIKISMERMVGYKFFWTDLYNLILLNDKIKDHFEEAYNQRMSGYKLLFKKLQNDRLLKQQEFEKELQFLIERMIDYSNTWLYASNLYEKKKINKAYIDYQSNVLLFMLYPYLTDKGKKQIQELMPSFFL